MSTLHPSLSRRTYRIARARHVPVDGREKIWTRDEFYRLIEMGVLEPRRYELIDGKLLDKMSQYETHHFCAVRLFTLLLGIFGADFLRFAGKMRISEISEPEPDVAVTRNPQSVYVAQDESPVPEEFLLAVEVSYSTLYRDTRIKTSVYARAGVPEYWILKVKARQLVVHRNPVGARYTSITIIPVTGTVSPLAKPDAIRAVADMLP